MDYIIHGLNWQSWGAIWHRGTGLDPPKVSQGQKVEKYTRRGCAVCDDYLGESADVAVGTVGAKHGYCTLITRTQVGNICLKNAINFGLMETVDEVDEAALAKAKEEKERRERAQAFEKLMVLALDALGDPKKRAEVRQEYMRLYAIDGKGQMAMQNYNGCVGCRICAEFCPANAIRINPAESEHLTRYPWPLAQVDEIHHKALIGGYLLRGFGTIYGPMPHFDQIVVVPSQLAAEPPKDKYREECGMEVVIGENTCEKPIRLQYPIIGALSREASWPWPSLRPKWASPETRVRAVWLRRSPTMLMATLTKKRPRKSGNRGVT